MTNAHVRFPRRIHPTTHTFAGALIAAAAAMATGNDMACHAAAAAESAPPWQSQLEGLPPVPEPAREDWLVSRPERRAGIFRGAASELVLDNGLVRRTFRLTPNAACIAFDQLATGAAILRAVRPECELTLDGAVLAVGGLTRQPIGNYLATEWLDRLETDPGALAFERFDAGPIEPRLSWQPRLEWLAQPPVWPPPGVHLELHFAPSPGARTGAGVRVTVHYELYDGLPLVGKWFTLHNTGERPVRIESFASEILACVEAESEVSDDPRPALPSLHVETDCTLVATTGESAQRGTARWVEDPSYTTQVSYRLQTPCLLECRPPLGPDVALEPGATFDSFRTWILAFDSSESTRRALALCRMYRALAPWAQENPLIFHIRSAEPAAVREGIDQAAAVGFELVIMTFGSGFDIENRSPAYRAQIRELAEYAHRRGVALGGYSLLASRSIGPADDVVNPATGQPGGFAIFGNSPCLGSAWGRDYFATLRDFFTDTGCDVLEHDGSYPGDACAATTHPGHVGYGDSYWRQREVICDFYRWCRGRGIYLNVPDWYILNGSSKTAMGYRETNWSLPRDYQEIIERQNIHDGTRYKTPAMGWMFVPLTEYHGGGAAATIEPLDAHRDHYARRLANLLGAGVQACFRGPRLYDTDATRAVVTKWVTFYKRHRPILDSDIIPLRRPDGRDWDGILHVNPQLPECGLAMIYNPLECALARSVTLPLYYTGLTETALVRVGDEPPRQARLDRQFRVTLDLELSAKGCTPVIIERP